MARLLALILTLATGFTGLVYEVTWQRSLTALIGSDSEAAAAVLALFLGGLALGYRVFGGIARANPDPRRLIAVYGVVEIGIGLHALLFPSLVESARALSAGLATDTAALAFAADLSLCAVLLGLPAISMGATVPLLTQSLARSAEEATRVHARIYALNTGGAFAGALAAAFWLVPALGLAGTLFAMAAINLAAGTAYLLIARAYPETSAETSAPSAVTTAPPDAPIAPTIALIALLLGFGAMTLQTTLLRMGALSLGGSPFTFAMVVAAFVLSIALGSAAVGTLRRVPSWLLPAVLGLLFLYVYALYTPLQDAPYFAHLLRVGFPKDAAALPAYHVATFARLALVIGPAAALSGAALPLLFQRLREQRGESGGTAGRLYAWNTLGSVLGALIGGYALYLWLDLHHIFRIAAGALATAAVLAFVVVTRTPWPRAVVFGLLPALGALVLLPPWSPLRLASGAFRMRTAIETTHAGPERFFDGLKSYPVIYYDDGPSASIAVKEYSNPDGVTDRALISNGKPDSAAVSEAATTVLAGLLPALFAEKHERAFVIGYGTGVTAGELARLGDFERIDVAEISTAVIGAAPLFDSFNGNASQHPSIHIQRTDAFRALLRSPERYDVISSEPSNPWVAGVELLFSVELLAEGRRHLAPGGVYAQWLQVYESDDETIALALRTFAQVFDHVAVWYGLGPDLLLLGFQTDARALDLAALERRIARPDFAAGLARAGIPDLPALLSHELLPLGTTRALGLRGPLHTIWRPRLRHAAARAFFSGASGRLPSAAPLAASEIATANSLARRYVASRGGWREPERASFVLETCRHRPHECRIVLAEWIHQVPHSEARRRVRETLAMSQTPQHSPDLSRVESLSRLFDEHAMLSAGDEGVIEAILATEQFEAYFHPSAPIPRSAVRALWERCEEASERRARCSAEREALEERLGPFGAPG